MEALMDRHLLIPGWAGELSLEETRFIQEEIQKDRGLRRRWGFRGKSQVHLTSIARRAYPENPKRAANHIHVEQVREGQRKAIARAKVSLPTS